MWPALVIALAVAAALLLAVVLLSWQRPALGPVDGRLRDCPDSPNCVCSFQSDPVHGIEPLRVAGDAATAWQRLLEAIEQQPLTRIVTRSDQYLHVEFTTPWLRFVDDVEFLRDDAAGVIHVRSASRVGRSDLGVNRRRVESLRAALTR